MLRKVFGIEINQIAEDKEILDVTLKGTLKENLGNLEYISNSLTDEIIKENGNKGNKPYTRAIQSTQKNRAADQQRYTFKSIAYDKFNQNLWSV